MPQTSRDRVLTALNHIEPDRVPVDFGGHRSSGIFALAYKKLRKHLGLEETPIRVYDMVQQLALVEDDVLERFGADVVQLGEGFCQEDKWWKQWQLPDGSDCLIPVWVDVRKEDDTWYLYNSKDEKMAVQKPGMVLFEQILWPYENQIPDDLSGLAEDLGTMMWSLPVPPNPEFTDFGKLSEGARKLRRSTDKAIMAIFGGNLLDLLHIMCGMNNSFLLLAAEPKKVHNFFDKLTELHLETLGKYLDAVGQYADIILFADDLGSQNGPQISPQMFRDYLKPRHKAIWQRVKEKTSLNVHLHCCGGVEPLLDDLIDAGLDSINPVQTSCVGMEPKLLKAKYGERLTFWGGGCDTQSILPFASPEQVREHTTERLEIFSPDGGFVFQQVHNIMPECPPENIVAMFDAVAEFNAPQ